MTASETPLEDDDPFEAAARREHADRLRREARIARVRKSISSRGNSVRRGDGSGMRTAFVVFLGPYLLWAALRAGNHAWTTPTVGRSIDSFFFGTGFWFGFYTAWMLFLLWVWAISAVAIRE